MAYSKLHSDLPLSTVWRGPYPTRILWVTMLALKDQDGVVRGSIPGLADAAHITLDECIVGLHELMSPDEHSRTTTLDGRRVVVVPEVGWLVVNHEKYRDLLGPDQRRKKDAERQARRRARLMEGNVTAPEQAVSRPSRDVTPRHVTSADSRDSHTSVSVAVSGSNQIIESEVPTTLAEAEIGHVTRSREPEPIWDALAEVLGYEPSTMSKGERGGWNVAVKELKLMGATPDEVRERLDEMQRRWPNITRTPLALAKHWASLSVAHEAPAPKESNRERQQREMLERLASHAPNPEPGDVVKGPRREDRGFSPIPDNPTTIEGILESLPPLPPSPPPWEELDEPEAQVAVGSMGTTPVVGIGHAGADHPAAQPDPPDEPPSQVPALPVDPFQRRNSTRIEQR